MRKLVTAVASLAVVSLLVPAIGLAIEPPVDNGIGILCIFTSEDIPSAANVIELVEPFVEYDLYFTVYHPLSDNLGGIEFSWAFEPTTSHVVTLFEVPEWGLNIGNNYNVIMGLGAGLPVNGDHVRVIHAKVMFTNPAMGDAVIKLGPSDPQTIEGEMAYNDFNTPENLYVLKPNSVDGLHDNPVFGLNMPIATEAETWGGVKSLFR